LAGFWSDRRLASLEGRARRRGGCNKMPAGGRSEAGVFRRLDVNQPDFSQTRDLVSGT